MSRAQELIDFVRGMRWHDIAKPLYLKSADHPRVGYVLWRALGREPEALMALAHFKLEHLAYHLDTTDDENLPAYLALGNAVDQLTSITYATEEEKPKDPPQPSAQNPFSRLPVFDLTINKRLAVEGSSGLLSKNIFRKDFYDFIGAILGSTLADELKVLIEEDLLERNNPGVIPDILEIFRDNRLDKQRLLDRLESYFKAFGERTYPTPNDTSLDEHCRLSAATAFVVYNNLWARDKTNWLSQRIVRNAEGKINLNGDETPRKQGEQKVAEHLDSRLMRIVFSGFEELFENAPRLDDLLGVREVVGLSGDSAEIALKTAFKQAFADELGVPDLADILVLREGPFDLVYLMPYTVPRDELKTKVAIAYEDAIRRIIEERILDVMADDFEGVPELRIREGVDELIEQWQGLPIGWAVEEIKVDSRKGDFRGLAEEFGRELLIAYQKVQEAASIVWTPGLQQYLKKHRAGQLVDVCEVCGTNPRYLEFNALLDQDLRGLLQEEREELEKKQDVLKKVVREFRDRPERLCRSCVAIRVMSHKKGGVEALKETLELLIEDRGDSAYVPESRDTFPDVPPLMRRGEIEVKGGDYVELDAAFVRRRHPRAPLERFPTISYAADQDSNVALVALRPVSGRKEGGTLVGGIFGRYDYSEALNLASYESADGQDFNKYYQGLITEKYVDQKASQAEPHIARALQRMTWIQRRFYDRLQQDLEYPGRLAENSDVPGAAMGDIRGIRVLPIQMEYPEALFVVPANRLLDAVNVLHVSAATHLFSSRVYEDPMGTDLLDKVLPPILLGSAVVFKHKQPLYVIMAAAQNMLDGLDRLNQGGELGDWGGILFGFADLRGVMSERELLQARSPFAEVYHVVDACDKVDRRSLLSTNALLLGEELPEGEKLPEIAGASLYIRGSKQEWDKETLRLLQENSYFKPVVFLKRMAR